MHDQKHAQKQETEEAARLKRQRNKYKEQEEQQVNDNEEQKAGERKRDNKKLRLTCIDSVKEEAGTINRRTTADKEEDKHDGQGQAENQYITCTTHTSDEQAYMDIKDNKRRTEENEDQQVGKAKQARTESSRQ
eukprot:16431378-Heterocapsa_arctica.AAC.1